MNRQECINLFKALNSLGDIKGSKFAYAVARNLSLLAPEMEAVNKAFVADDAFTKFEEERIELAKKYSKKDDKGEPMMQLSKSEPGAQEFVLDDVDGFQKSLKKLQEKHKEALDKRSAFLNEAVVIALHKVALSDVPVDISTAQMAQILSIVTE